MRIPTTILAVLAGLSACSYELGVGTCEHAPVASECKDGYCRIPAGCFFMGSPLDEPCREGKYGGKETLHRVRLTRSFWLAEREVTQIEYEAAMGSNPSAHQVLTVTGKDCETGGCVCEGGALCDQAPVEMVRWGDAAAYCNALSVKAGRQLCYESDGKLNRSLSTIYDCRGYRLPTEAEWEYAYRAGTRTAYHSGPNDPRACQGKDSSLDAIAWYRSTLGLPESTALVGKRGPNPWGLYDLAGNVFEWVHDGYIEDLGEEPALDPVGQDPLGKVVTRGGAVEVFNYPMVLRAAYRSSRDPTKTSHMLGFRCARSD